jgi:transposase-like protein
LSGMPWCAVGRKYKVTDNAVRKWAKQYGVWSRDTGFKPC